MYTFFFPRAHLKQHINEVAGFDSGRVYVHQQYVRVERIRVDGHEGTGRLLDGCGQ